MIEYRSRQNIRSHKRTSSSGFQQNELSHRAYRALLAFFVDNLNLTAKNYQVCMPDLEEQPRIRVSAQEQKTVENDLKGIFRKMGSKLVKDCNFRNALIRKCCQEYLKQFEPYAEKYRKQFGANILDGKNKMQKKAQFRLKPSVTVKEADNGKNFSRASFRKQINGMRPESRSKTQENRIVNSILCKTSEFIAYQSEQLQRKQTREGPKVRTKTSTDWHRDWHRSSNKARRGSLYAAHNPQSENAEVLVIRDEAVITETACEDEWELEKYKDVKPVQSFISNRVLAMRNRQKTTPEMQLTKIGFRPSGGYACVNQVQHQGYRPLSKHRV